MTPLLRLRLLPVAMGALSRSLFAQTILEYDHAKEQARLIKVHGAVAETTVVGSGSRVILGSPDTVRLRVTNTNTALYRFTRQAQAVPAPGLDPLRTFLGTIKPYLPEVALLVGGSPGPAVRGGKAGVARSILPADLPFGTPAIITRAWSAGKRVELDVATIDESMYGSGGVRHIHAEVLATLERMRTGDVERAAGLLRETLHLAGDGCSSGGRTRQLPVTLALLQAIEDLQPAQVELQQALLEGNQGLNSLGVFIGLSDSLRRIGIAADSAASDYERLVTVAYRVESLSLSAAYACSSWTGGNYPIKRDSGRSITLSIDARPEPELGRVADRPLASYTVTFLPRWTVRPSLGASLLIAPRATFARFGARSPATGGGTEVYESGIQDSRFGWGITLGFTWRGLTFGRGEKPTLAFWLPELTVNPSGDSKAFSVGGGVSFRFFKLGTGLSWIRHSELVDLTVGQAIPNKDFLRVKDTYGSPKLYVSVSIFDWPPFLAK